MTKSPRSNDFVSLNIFFLEILPQYQILNFIQRSNNQHFLPSSKEWQKFTFSKFHPNTYSKISPLSDFHFLFDSHPLRQFLTIVRFYLRFDPFFHLDFTPSFESIFDNCQFHPKIYFKTSTWNEYVFDLMGHPTYVISKAKWYVLIWIKNLIPLTCLKKC